MTHLAGQSRAFAVPQDQHGPHRYRIAHFVIGRCNPDSANGIDKTAYHLAAAQARLGHEVRMCCLTDKEPVPIPGVKVASYAPRTFTAGIRVPRLDHLLGRLPWSIPSALTRDLGTWHPHVVHLHFVYVPQNVVLATYGRRRGVPYVVTINGGLAPECQRRNRWVKRLFRWLAERRYLERAAFIHAISEQDVHGISEYGVRNRIVVAPNGLDIATIPENPRPEYLPDRFPQLRGKRVFLFLGRLDPEQKGLDVLVEGFAAVQSPGAALLLVGPDWRGGRAHLEQLVHRFEAGDRVHFAGPAFGTEKYDLIAGADVFVHPSRWEAGVPFSVMEAAALRRPCLFTRGADANGTLVDHGTGIEVSPNAKSIAAGISQFLELEPAALARMGENARTMVEKEFAWEVIATRILAAYAEHLHVHAAAGA